MTQPIGDNPTMNHIGYGLLLGHVLFILLAYLAIVVCVYAAVVVVTWLLHRHDRPPGHCRSCGYNLTGNVSGRCPECGKGT